ncbi:MAG: tetratricopeptide repeat protein [Novosphingobium sp.]|nr:tetratricopeptide repeat protein [Novosphingobium sp.]
MGTLALALASLAAPPLLAAGGGGGGGGTSMPSESARRYDPAAEYQKGAAAFQGGDFKAAATAFKRVTDVVPKHAPAQYLLGSSYLQLGEFKKAKKPLEMAVKHDATLVDAQRDLGIVYAKLGEAAKAEAQRGALAAMKTACAEPCAKSAQLDAAIAAVAAAIGGAPQALAPTRLPGAPAAADAAYVEAVGLINEGRYEAALAVLQGAMWDHGPHPDLLTYAGFANRKLQRYAGGKLQALTWIAAGEEAAALTRQPATCLAATDADVLAGRALFEAPQLFGGQAERAGLSCASCHTNGRANPHFFLAGISDAPGTADVTASFFSVARGNARFDPRPIPDLATPGRISREPHAGDVERFTRGLIVEEFAGAEPSPAALARLSAYVRAVRPCPDRVDERQSLAARLDVLRDTVVAAARFADEGDRATATLLIGAARFHLGLIDERLAPGGNRAVRARLLRTSRELQRIRDAGSDAHGLRTLLARFDRTVAPRLRRAEKRSLYRREWVARWLGATSGQTGASGT